MNSTFKLTRISNLLIPVSRAIPVEAAAEYSLLGIRLDGGGAFLREKKIGSQIAATTLFQVKKGDFIYSRLFAWRGAFGLIGEDLDGCFVSSEFPTFVPMKDKVDKNFLQYWFRLSTTLSQVESNCTGSTPLTRNRFKEQFFLALEIPLPPLTEQRRIMARIEEVASRIEEARGLRREATKEGEALINVTARKLLAIAEIEPTELRQWTAKDRDGIQTGPFGAQLGLQDFESIGVPILTIGNVQYGGLQLNGLRYVSEEKAQELIRFSIKAGDILFARMGTVGRCCVVPQSADGWLFNYHIIRLALDDTKVNPRYIHWSIRSSLDIEEFLSEKIRGATREGVNSSIVGSLPVRIPLLDEQNNIVFYLDNLQAKVDALKHLQAETAAELDALLPSVLDKAFKGEL